MMLRQAAGARSVLRREPERAAAALDEVREAGNRSAGELGRLHALLEPSGGAATRRPGPEGLDATVGVRPHAVRPGSVAG
jgi:hypothetical protein